MGFIISFFALSLSSVGNKFGRQYRIFSDIEAMDILLPYVTENIDYDKYMKEIEPTKQFCKKIEYEIKYFEVYAYVFNSSEELYKYVKNRTDRSIENNKGFQMYGNIFFSTEYFIYYENSLLFIKGSASESVLELLDFIQQDFHVEL